MTTGGKGNRDSMVTSDEKVGKVFVVVAGMRRCLICERDFAPREAAQHVATVCGVKTADARG